MSMNELERLRERAAKVELPSSVRDAVMAEATALDAPQQTGRALTRRNFVRVGAAAAAVGVASFLGLSIFGKGGERSFVLTAYAEGTDQGDGTRLPLANFAGDWCEGPSDAEGMYDAYYTFKLGCDVEGPGATSITYTLEGPYAKSVTIDEACESTEPCIYFYDLAPDDRESYYTASITVPYNGEPVQERIMACFPMSDELLAASDAFQAVCDEVRGTGQQVDLEIKREMVYLARLHYNELLTATTLRIAVTYSDGKLLEKSYAIAPIDNFEEVFDAYLDACAEAEKAYYADYSNQQLQDEYLRAVDDQPPLYTVRELEG